MKCTLGGLYKDRAGRHPAPNRREAQPRDQVSRIQERFASIGDEPAGGTPEGFGAVIRIDSAKWREVIVRSGAKFD